MWVATEDLPRSAAHPFHTRLNQIFNKHDFDDSIEGLCQRFYAEDIGRPGTLVVYTSKDSWMATAPVFVMSDAAV